IVVAKPNGFGSKILRQFNVVDTVTDDEGMGQIICRCIKISSQQCGPRFACGCIFERKCAVDVFGGKSYPLASEGVDDKAVHRPEVLFRMRSGTQAVLV